MVPNGTSSVAAEVPYRPGEPVDRSALTERVLDDLVGSGILTKSDHILVTGTLVLDPAYVVYDLNHRRSVDAVHSYLLSNNIRPCGRFGEWEYLNMDHALLSGKAAARRVLETIGQQLAAE
jgi:UDP-galactopyranose mutase